MCVYIVCVYIYIYIYTHTHSGNSVVKRLWFTNKLFNQQLPRLSYHNSAAKQANDIRRQQVIPECVCGVSLSSAWVWDIHAENCCLILAVFLALLLQEFSWKTEVPLYIESECKESVWLVLPECFTWQSEAAISKRWIAVIQYSFCDRPITWPNTKACTRPHLIEALNRCSEIAGLCQYAWCKHTHSAVVRMCVTKVIK